MTDLNKRHGIDSDIDTPRFFGVECSWLALLLWDIKVLDGEGLIEIGEGVEGGG